MKNKYETRGEVTAIFIKSPKYGELETLINTDDLEKVNRFPNSWCVIRSADVDALYVVGRLPTINGKHKYVTLHRLIMDAPVGMVVDHINHNTLDNRRIINLRLASRTENQQNKIRAHSNNKTGILGVCWHKASKKWQANIQVNKKPMHLGLFNSIEDAEDAVIKARLNYMPFSQETLRTIRGRVD